MSYCRTALVALLIALFCATTASAQGARDGEVLSIINGTQVTAGQMQTTGRWSALAAIVTASEPNAYYGQFCGGTLIAPAWVLTAAHCVFGDYDDDGDKELAAASSMDVVLGRRDLTASDGQRTHVDMVVPYTDYLPGSNTLSDVALLRLAQDVPGSVARPMQLIGASEASLWAPGQTLHIAGWGNQTANLCPTGGGSCTAAGESSWTHTPTQADIPRVSDTTCGSGPDPGYSYFWPSTMMCAGVLDTDGVAGTTNGLDTCQGDSGGPLIADPGTGAADMRLVGATSFGRGCGSVNYGVYTRLAAFTTWVDERIAANGGPSRGGGGDPGDGGGGDPGDGGGGDPGDGDGGDPGDGGGGDPGGGPGGGGDMGGGTGGGPPCMFDCAGTPPGDGTPAGGGTGDGGGGGGTTTTRGMEATEPNAPTNLRMTRRTATSVSVAWDAPVGGTPVDGYTVDWGDDSDETGATTGSVTIAGLQPGKSYTITVTAFDADGNTSEDAVTTASTVRDAKAPVMSGAPGIKRAGRSATVTWKAAKDDHVVASYRIVVRVGSAWRTVGTVPGTKRSFKIRSLPAKASAVAVQAVDASGNVGARSRVTKVRG